MMTLIKLERIKKFFGPQDMTVGSPMVGLMKFSIPLLIGNFAQQMYSTVDSIVVGKYVGDGALAAVGASFPALNLLLVLIVGISTGTTVMVSQYFGAKDKDKLSRTVGTCLILTLLASVVMVTVGFFASESIINALRTPADIKDMSVQYLQILFLGIWGWAFFNITSGILRGMGDSIYPLIFLLLASVLNIFLDILFITQFHMGVAGVALATIISQVISATLCFFRLYSMKSVLNLNRDTFRLDRQLAIQLGQLGLPAGITQAIFALSSTAVQSLTNSLGTQVIAASIVVMRVDGFAMMPNFTFGMAATTFVGQNIGAGKIDRVYQGTKDALKMGFSVAALLTLSLLLFGSNLMHMFTDTEALVALGVRGMRILAVGYIAFAGTQILMGVMRGAGDTTRLMWISIFTTVALRIPIAYIWAWMTRSDTYPNGSPDCLFASLLITWVIGFLITLIVYRRGAWKEKAIIVADENHTKTLSD